MRAAGPDLTPASDRDIVCRGEKVARMEQISAICVKERLDGALAEARARAEQRALGGTAPTIPGHRETGHVPGLAARPLNTVSLAALLGKGYEEKAAYAPPSQ
ncbi:hypothetical protein D1007_33062 [Hordeum vulgare]|nr:hypothetical protein D1007_33062 [Hordeum vulgare]